MAWYFPFVLHAEFWWLKKIQENQLRSLVVQDTDLANLGHCVEFQGCSLLPSLEHKVSAMKKPSDEEPIVLRSS